jgi:hypothetical protein
VPSTGMMMDSELKRVGLKATAASFEVIFGYLSGKIQRKHENFQLLQI